MLWGFVRRAIAHGARWIAAGDVSYDLQRPTCCLVSAGGLLAMPTQRHWSVDACPQRQINSD